MMKNRIKFAIREGFVFFLDTIFFFGKYKGMNVDQVLKVDCKYLRWCLTEIENFIISPTVDHALRREEMLLQ